MIKTLLQSFYKAINRTSVNIIKSNVSRETIIYVKKVTCIKCAGLS